VSTVDDKLLQALFRALHAADQGKVGRIDIEAATKDGVAGLTIMAMPTQLADYVSQQLASFTVIDIGRGGQ
jgi:hypothetical protein